MCIFEDKNVMLLNFRNQSEGCLNILTDVNYCIETSATLINLTIFTE